MNGLLIAVLAIIIGCILWGYWKGFVKIAFSLVTMLLTIVLVSWVTPYISDFLKENTSVYETLVEKCTDAIQLSAKEDVKNNIADTEDTIGGIQLPRLWVEQIMEKAGDSVDQVMEERGIYRMAGEYIADWILRGAAFFVAFILVFIALRVVFGLLNIVAKLPLLKSLNRLLGGVAGLLQGMVIVWLLLFVVAIACTSQLGQSALRCIDKSAFLTFLYQHNGILYLFHLIF